MKLHIIGGHLKHRSIKIAGAKIHFRPTKEIVRGAVADFLNEKITGASVADICAGSGALGFEMLSRGAQYVHFVDNNRTCCRNIINCARLFNVEKQCRVFKKDVRSYLRTCKHTFDIIYYDPPYNDLELIKIIPNLLPYVSAGGILIFEQEVRKSSYSFALLDEFKVDTRRYGETVLDFFIHSSDKNINIKKKDA